MNVILTVLEIVAPVILLASVGFAWVKCGFEYRMEFVTRLTMTFSVPCLIFVALMQTQVTPEAISQIALATFVSYAVLTAVFFCVLIMLRFQPRVYLAPLIFGNTGNLGLPLAVFAFGDAGLGYAIVVFATMAILSFTFGIWLVAGNGNLTRILREPIVGATFLGGVFLWNDWTTPAFLTNTLELIGQMAIPLMLITLGVAVARLHAVHLKRAIGLSVLKIIFCAATGWGVGIWFDLASVPMAVLVVQLSTPVAVTSYLIATKYAPSGAGEVAGLVVVSTVMSALALPLILAFVI